LFVKQSIAQGTLLIVGALLLFLAWAPGVVPAAYALPLAALTPTAEPPTRTPPPTAGGTPVPTLPPRPTLPPSDTPGPTNTPKPRPTGEPGTDHADPAVTKAVSPSEARIGDIVDFTITVTNHGDKTADDVVVTDVLPDFLDVAESNTSKGTIATSGRTVVITIGPVAPGEEVLIHILARVNAQAQPPGGRNSVTLTSSNNSDDLGNNTSSIALSILAPAASPTATPIEVSGTPAGGLPTATPEVAGGSARPSQPAAPGRPKLPSTGAGDERPAASWPLALLGLSAIVLSLVLRRRGARKA
jgi:uncharacterized repeat protein (TIGR01451 family)